MPRMNQQKAVGSHRCAYQVLSTGWNGEMVSRTCGKSKKAHGPTVKSPITSHPYGGEDGDLVVVDFPECGVCHRQIAKGEEYRFWQPRHGARHTRCMTCPPPSRSIMTGSEILSMAWSIADEAPDLPEGSTESDADTVASDLAEQIGEIVSLIEEKLDNIESGMGHTDVPVYEELEERKSGYEDWQQEVESLDFSDCYADPDATPEDDDECATCGETYGEHRQPDDDGGAYAGGPDGECVFDPAEKFDVSAALELISEAMAACPE